VRAEPRLLAVEDLYGLPADDRHHELLAGKLISEPPPGAEILSPLVLRAADELDGEDVLPGSRLRIAELFEH
jgi:hypothetical protein